MKKQKVICAMLAILLILACTSAQAQTVSMNERGLRFYVPDGWRVIVRGDAQAAEQLNISAEVFDAQLDAHGIILYAMDEKEEAFTLKCSPAPYSIGNDNALRFTSGQWDQFIDKLNQTHLMAAISQEDAPAPFVYITYEREVQGLTVYTAAYQTLMYGQLISIEHESFAQKQSPAILSKLRKAAESVLFLGGKLVAVNSEKPFDTPLPDAAGPVGTAAQTIVREDIPLTLDEIPLVVTTSQFTLTGTTVPGAKLRYYVNKTGIERFEADENGRFEVTIRKLKAGENNLRIESIHEKQYGIVSARVTLDQDPTPAALEAYELTCDAPTFLIRGITLPDAQVKLKLQSRTVNVPLNEDGTFSYEVSMSKAQDYTYTFEITSPLYKKNKLTLLIHHELTPEERAAAFRKDARKAKSDSMVETGSITALGYENGNGYALFAAEDGDTYLVFTDSFFTLDIGQTGEMLFTRLNQARSFGDQSVQEATFFAFYPNH